MVNVLIISHSKKLVDAIVDFANLVKTDNFDLVGLGGTDNGKAFGTDATQIKKTILKLSKNRDLVIIYDLGSSLLNARLALDKMPESIKKKVYIADCAFLEGVIVATTSNSANSTGYSIKKLLEEQCRVAKS